MFKFILLCIVFGIVTCGLSSEWERFKRDYGKQYETDVEEVIHKQRFIENIQRMHRFQQTHPDATFTMKINYLADQRIEV